MNMGFFKKELMELRRTHKLIVVTSVFLFFSILSPLTARYMSEIFEALGGDIVISFPEPTYLDSWIQFFKNMTSICLIVYILTLSGTVAGEKAKGSILLVLSKNVSRKNFILSKTAAGALLYTVAYIPSALICEYYTSILFPDYPREKLLYALLLLWILGIFYAVFTVLISVLSRSVTIAAVICFAGYALMNIPGMFPAASLYTPAGISTIGTELLSGALSVGDSIKTLVITIILSIVMLAASLFYFKKQEI
jgi:ABC-2 type transport system permease protein